MLRRYVTIDVFTSTAFGGNPLAVVLDGAELSSAQMQALAREFNYSETTFVLPPADPAHTAQVRIFTPAFEVPFAGHPNVGTAVVLASRAPPPGPSHVTFEEAAGLVVLEIETDGGLPAGASLTAPVAFQRGATVALAQVAEAAGLAASDFSVQTHVPVAGSAGLPFVFAELTSRAALRQSRPSAALLPGLLQAVGAVGLFLYTRDQPGAGCDIEARMFCPMDSAIIEDPATGSANVALAGLLASCAAASDQDLRLRVGQGVDMGRPSLLLARAVKRDGQVVSTHVGGRCVEMMQGSFTLAGNA